MAENMDGSTVEGTPMSAARLRMLKARAEHGHVGHLGRANMLELIHEIERLQAGTEAHDAADEKACQDAMNDAHDGYGSSSNT